jgi:phosphoribosylanthranilate isomerase
VFVNSSIAELADAIDQHRLCGVQFHGDEQVSAIAELKQLLTQRWSVTQVRDITCIRAIRADATREPPSSDRLTMSQIVRGAEDWINAGADAILLDAAPPGVYGGSGLALDWQAIGTLDLHFPIILAGGLTPINVAEAIRRSHTLAVDVASGVENAVGQKDEHLMRLFVQNTGWNRN